MMSSSERTNMVIFERRHTSTRPTILLVLPLHTTSLELWFNNIFNPKFASLKYSYQIHHQRRILDYQYNQMLPTRPEEVLRRQTLKPEHSFGKFFPVKILGTPANAAFRMTSKPILHIRLSTQPTKLIKKCIPPRQSFRLMKVWGWDHLMSTNTLSDGKLYDRSILPILLLTVRHHECCTPK